MARHQRLHRAFRRANTKRMNTRSTKYPHGVPSPCISVCTLDMDTGFCNGCKRTSDEIEFWAKMSEAEKEALLDVLEQRKVDTGSAY